MRWDAHSNVSGSSARAKLFKAASCRTKDCGGAKKFHSRQLKKSGNGKNPCGPSPVRKAGVNRSSVSSGQRNRLRRDHAMTLNRGKYRKPLAPVPQTERFRTCALLVHRFHLRQRRTAPA
jgi:hypothetical protein